jgi:hypothetical protein
LDENVEHEVEGRLEALGHDIEHVDSVPELGKGASDSDLTAFSLTADRTIVTYDDDFVEDVPPEEYRAVLFFEDDTLSVKAVAEIVHTMASVYPHEEVRGLQKPGASGCRNHRPRNRNLQTRISAVEPVSRSERTERTPRETSNRY